MLSNSMSVDQFPVISRSVALRVVLVLRAQWYFCSLHAATDGAITCMELPTYTPGVDVYICSSPKGARPGYSE